MNTTIYSQESLFDKVEEWKREGMITASEAAAIVAYEQLSATHRVSPREIFVYMGGFFILLAVGFGMQVMWEDLGSLIRVLIIGLPTALVWGAGDLLRRRDDAALLRGAKAAWMVATWLTVIFIAVALHEYTTLDFDSAWLLVWAGFGALPLALIALYVLPGLPQGLATIVVGLVLAIGLDTLIDNTWPTVNWWLFYAPWAGGGVLALVGAEIAYRRGHDSLVWLFNLAGALSLLLMAQLISLDDKMPLWETLVLVESLAILAWSVVRQSRALLYTGALFLLIYIINLNFEYFEDQLGLPAVLLITGLALITVGLGVDRMRRRLVPAH